MNGDTQWQARELLLRQADEDRILGLNRDDKVRGAGGTPGGVGEFFVGLAMAVAGAWLLTNRVVVTSGAWALWGFNSFGLSLLPLLIGTALLFFNGKSVAGWLLLFSGIVIVFAGILVNMHIYFQSTTLFDTLVMLVLLSGGVGLIARSLRARG